MLRDRGPGEIYVNKERTKTRLYSTKEKKMRIRTAQRDTELASWLAKDPDANQLLGVFLWFLEANGFPQAADEMGRKI